MKNKKTIITLTLIITLLTINLNLSTHASTEYKNDGIWTDNLLDYSGISDHKNCTLDGDNVSLKKTNIYEYNFSTKDKHRMWSGNWFFMLGRNNRLFNRINPLGEKEIKQQGHKKLNDGKAINTSYEGFLLNPPVFHHFRFNISFKKSDINSLKISWYSGKNVTNSNIKYIQIYLWNYSKFFGGWENKKTIYTNEINPNKNINTDIKINNNHSVNKEGNIDLLIVATPDRQNEECVLSTDYIKLTANASISRYAKKGYIISEEINPDKLGKWESITWNSTKATEKSNVKIQILKGDNNEIINNSILPGNEKGFNKKPIDLTPLSIKNNQEFESIKVKAILTSNKSSVTPHLYKWSATWQTEDNKFKDLFTTKIRLDKPNGAKIENDGIHIKNNRNESEVISYPIHLPADKWWGKFQADNNTEGNIQYSILDRNYNILVYNVEDGDNISNKIDTDVIRIKASITRENETFDPLLKSWGVSWNSNAAPVLIEDSFKPESGWINTKTPICEIKARDNMPGLDTKSARYKIFYNSSNESEIIASDWIDAKCTGVKGSTANETITIDISKSDMSKDIESLKKLTISIKDIAGYETRFTTDLKEDKTAPTSNILNEESFSSIYTKPVIINASAKDLGKNKSGVKSVSLLYKLKEEEEWKNYKTIPSPYIWNLEIDEVSGELELCTRATDKAGNIESIPEEGELSFIYDIVKPSITNLKDEYRFNELPHFSMKFKDDYKISKVEYRLGFHGLNNWTILEEDISEKSATIDWNLTVEDWNKLNEKEVYHVFFRVTDWLGNTYEIKESKNTSKLIKDLTACKPYLDLSELKGISIGNDFTIYATAKEEEINKIQVFYRYSEDKEGWTDWKSINKLFEEPFKWNFTAESGNGYYQFKTKTWDKSGNSGYSPVEEVNVKTIPMTPLIALISLIIVLLVLTAVYIFKMKKNKEI